MVKRVLEEVRTVPPLLLLVLALLLEGRVFVHADWYTRSCQSRILELHDCTFAAASGLTRVLGPLHLRNHKLKGLLYVLVVARAGFGVGTFELGGEGFAVFRRDLALFGTQVRLIAHDDERNPFDGKVVQDLIANDARHLKALLVGNRVDNHVAMNADKVLRVENAVFILASRIDDLSRIVLVLVLDHLAESILDGRVVAVDKVPVDELHRQTRLADGSAADNGHLSLLGRGRHLAAGFGRRS